MEFNSMVKSWYFYHFFLSKIRMLRLVLLKFLQVGQDHNKEYYSMFSYTFLAFLAVFHHKICVFIIFISFFDKVLNFRNSVNQSETRVSDKNCQWNCILKVLEYLRTCNIFYRINGPPRYVWYLWLTYLKKGYFKGTLMQIWKFSYLI